jgi:hypothetical protein
VVAVTEAQPPFDLIVDALNTAERTKGQVRTAFARQAFAFRNGRVEQVVTLGQMDLADVPGAATESAGGRERVS